MDDYQKKPDPRITAKEAVALSHDPVRGDPPRVSAKASGELAEEMIRLALEHRIPIKYDPDLIQVLSNLDVGQDIPQEVYLVVAEILAFIYWVNQEFFPGQT
ncbi:MAG: EscU/YscU/HrcU family type III secretion system export apparatus switch protein [Proteobacteria bacterium]|nr:EscU/YscU/HrcU family type III secretion system export apparatus switch protein [Pseudomonadota bacterium]